MNRYPPIAVIRNLRTESNFKCSVPNCDIPYLEYHHFDPPWYILNHHNPNGMISLCPQHHRQADAHAWTTEQLIEFKTRNQSEEIEDVIKGKFNYLRNQFLLYAGGNYFFNNSKAEIVLRNHPIVWFEINENGLKQLNIILFNEKGEIYFHIENNSWKVKNNIKDLECPPNGKILRVDFDNGNYIKIEFIELDTIEKLGKNINHPHMELFLNILPITLLKINLKMIEFKIDFQSNKIINGNHTNINCLSSDNTIGMRL